jgi:multicomponent Na+:H+ antiporter subunit D
MLQLLLFSALAFVFLVKTGLYPAELRSVVLDVDWVWRRLLPRAWSGVSDSWMIGRRAVFATLLRMRSRMLRFTEAHLSPGSRLGEPWPTGETAMWAAGLLIVYLYLSF